MSESFSRLWEGARAEGPVAELSPSACWRALAETTLGRIAIAVAGDVEIFPVNYTVSDGMIYLRTAPGSKLLGLTAHPAVAFEIDGHDAEAASSVAVKGVAERLERQSEIDAADRLPLAPWIPTLKYRWVRIRPTQVTGRAFRREPEPERC